uniref:Uncharacterized protein n=1 Tax=Molossus molossus TaxID=27622 RepID=A0A7J8BYK1_MOLMO|nr:hypothetical protein HJG59_010068 [Molossus molossus]
MEENSCQGSPAPGLLPMEKSPLYSCCSGLSPDHPDKASTVASAFPKVWTGMFSESKEAVTRHPAQCLLLNSTIQITMTHVHPYAQ